VKGHVRLLLAAAALALLAGWLGLQRGNAALEARLSGAGAPRQEAAR
jgi:hypothetical protein